MYLRPSAISRTADERGFLSGSIFGSRNVKNRDRTYRPIRAMNGEPRPNPAIRNPPDNGPRARPMLLVSGFIEWPA